MIYCSNWEGDTAKLLEKMFPPDYVGVYVDVGAGYPEYWSNSDYFRKKGWLVIAIEPQPQMCNEYRELGYEVLQYACTDTDAGEVSFECLDNMGGMSSSTFKIVETHQYPDNPQVTTIKVQARKLDTLLEEFYPEVTKIDIVDIDVERSELAVLKGFNTDKYQPAVMVIENHRQAEGWINPDEDAIHDYYDGIGYDIIGFAAWNEFVAPKDSKLARRAGAGMSFMEGFDEPSNEHGKQTEIWNNFTSHNEQWGGMEHDPHDHTDGLYEIPYVKAGLELYQQYVPSDARRILEIGCAQGYILNHVGPPDAERVGIDFNEDRIRKGRLQYPDTHFIAGDIRNMPIDDEFDVVLLPGVIEHVRFQESRDMLDLALRIVEPGGILLFDLPWWTGSNFNHGIHQNPCHCWTGTRYRWDWLFRGIDVEQIIIPEYDFYAFGIIRT